MYTFKEMKNALISEGASAKFFTKTCYETFLEERKKSFDAYIASGKFLGYPKTYQSDFYVKNGCDWCLMLEIFNEHLPCFQIELFNLETSISIHRTQQRFTSFEDAKAWTERTYPQFFAEIKEL